MFLLAVLPVYGQHQGLVLRKGAQEIFIAKGDWIVIADASGRIVVAGGVLQYIFNDTLTLHEPTLDASGGYFFRPIESIKHMFGKRDTIWQVHRAPASSIDYLYHGEAKRIAYYLRKATASASRFAGMVAAVNSIGVGIKIIGPFVDYGPDNSPSILTRLLVRSFVAGVVYGIASVVYRMYTIPIGAIIGTLGGLDKNGQAVGYSIGPDQWEIILQ